MKSENHAPRKTKSPFHSDLKKKKKIWTLLPYLPITDRPLLLVEKLKKKKEISLFSRNDFLVDLGNFASLIVIIYFTHYFYVFTLYVRHSP